MVQEAGIGYIQEGSLAFQCLYDLEKAFDSVEYWYRSGINGKAWKIIRSLYADLCAQVRIGKELS